MTLPSPLTSPAIQLANLDELWFQVGGTLCNLACTHCFISCSPKNQSFGLLDLETVKRFLGESLPLGVKEYYFTGGEPFLNPAMVPILKATLEHGPATVLTNGTVFRGPQVRELGELAAQSRFSLEIRVSIDGASSDQNDPIRGAGAFQAALRGVALLVEHGFLPIITMVETWPEAERPEVLGRLVGELKALGYSRPRLKVLPILRLGMEERRSRHYLPEERVTEEMMEGYDPSRLLCHHGRMVTDRGVAVCPILIEAPDAHLGKTLLEACRPFSLRHSSCYTCYLYGAICSNPTAPASGTDR